MTTHIVEIDFNGVDFEVEFSYSPEEKEVRYYSDGSGYPGCPEEIEILEIKHKDTCFLEFLEDDYEEIGDLALARLKQNFER